MLGQKHWISTTLRPGRREVGRFPSIPKPEPSNGKDHTAPDYARAEDCQTASFHNESACPAQ